MPSVTLLFTCCLLPWRAASAKTHLFCCSAFSVLLCGRQGRRTWAGLSLHLFHPSACLLLPAARASSSTLLASYMWLIKHAWLLLFQTEAHQAAHPALPVLPYTERREEEGRFMHWQPACCLYPQPCTTFSYSLAEGVNILCCYLSLLYVNGDLFCERVFTP